MMKIDDAIKRLEEIKKKWGNVEIFFDCPHCNKSFSPDIAVPVVMVKVEKKIAE